MKLSSIDISIAPKHIIIYGPPKSGKTFLALQLAQHYNIHYLGFEAGENVGKQLPMEWQNRIDVIRIPDTRHNPVAIHAMLRLAKNGKIDPCVLHGMDGCPICKKEPTATWNHLDVKEFSPPFPMNKDILVIDSLTQLTTSIMAHIGRGGGEDWKPEYDDWRKMGTFLDMILSEFQNAPYNVICISHESLVDTEDEKQKKIVPVAGTANFSRNTAKYFDTVIYAEIRNGKHSFSSKTTYANNILTGDRFNVDLNKEPEKGLLPLFQGSNLIVKK